MKKETEVYRALQKHLDEQPVGYPETRSGAEIRLLECFFTPEEAKVAMFLSHKPRSLEEIFKDIRHEGMTKARLETLLDAMLKKFSIGYQERGGTQCFHTLPFIVGMYEGQVYRLTPDFLADMSQYTSNKSFGLELVSSRVSQMRTIPVEKSIIPKHLVSTYDEIIRVLNDTEEPFVVVDCICRRTAQMAGNKCEQTSRLETCLAMRNWALQCKKANMGKVITRGEAIELMRKNQKDGLVLQPSNSQEPQFVCSCCKCCCGMLSSIRLWRTRRERSASWMSR